MSTKIVGLALLIASFQLNAHSEADPVLSKFKVDELALNLEETKKWSLEGDYWRGRDLDKFWLKFEAGSEVEDSQSEVNKLELQALYSKAVSANWDLQLGLMHNFKQEQAQTWGVIGFQGLAPYWIEVDAALFVGERNQLAGRLELEYELMLNQEWRLVPEIRLDFFAQNNQENHQGTGLSSTAFEVALVHDVSRQLGFFIKYEKEQYYGKSADYRAIESEPTGESELSIGLTFWF